MLNQWRSCEHDYECILTLSLHSGKLFLLHVFNLEENTHPGANCRTKQMFLEQVFITIMMLLLATSKCSFKGLGFLFVFIH